MNVSRTDSLNCLSGMLMHISKSPMNRVKKPASANATQLMSWQKKSTAPGAIMLRARLDRKIPMIKKIESNAIKVVVSFGRASDGGL